MPAEAVGLLTKVGVGIASAESQAVASQILLDGFSSDLRPRVNRAVVGAGAGSYFPRRALTTHMFVEGGVSALVTPNAFGYLLVGALGITPTTSGTAPTYTHTFRYGAASPSRFLTVAFGFNDVNKQEVYGGLRASRMRLSFSAERSEPLTVDFDLIGTLYMLFNSETTVFPSGIGVDSADPFVQPLAVVESPIGTAVAKVVEGDLDFALETDIRWTLRGSIFPRGMQPMRSMRVTGRLVFTFESDDERKAFINRAGATTYPMTAADSPDVPVTSLRLKWAPASSRQLQIDLPRIVWTELSSPVRQGEVITQELSFEALFSSTDNYGMQITLVNSTSAYNAGTVIGSGS